MAPTVIATAVLLVQLMILVLLGYGVYRWKKKTDLKAHARLQTIAAFLNLATVLAIMVPSFLRTATAQPSLSNQTFVLVTVHHIIGLVALILSLVLAGGWLLSGRKANGCPGKPPMKRALMRAIYVVWILSIVLGIWVYYIYYIG